MPRRLLVIGLDAAESSLIERWTADGTLPVLAALRRAGTYGRLASTADWFVGSTWMSFYSGRNPAETGGYHNIVWRPERMDHGRPDEDMVSIEPFWRPLSRQGPRVIAFDVPMTQTPRPFNGIEINGWANNDLIGPIGSWPPDVFGRVGGDVRRPPFFVENYRLQTVDELLELRDGELVTCRAVTAAASALLQREPWDLALVCLQAAHIVGHKLWDDGGVAGAVPADRRDAFDGALRSTYVACDTAVGRLVEAAGGDVDVLVIALHGMGPNLSRTDLLGDLLRRIAGATSGPSAGRERLARVLRRLLPHELRYNIKRRMPFRLQDRLTVFWRVGAPDWSRTRAFPVFADLTAYVRLNLEGREAQGCVDPADRVSILDDIAEALGDFRDADTGEPILGEARRTEEIYPKGLRHAWLPDLVVRWSDQPAARHRAIVSSRYGDIAWPTPGRHPTGRSGNHRPDGFLIAGPGIAERIDPSGGHIVDLAPTIWELMGLAPPPGYSGRSLVRAQREPALS